MGTAQMTPLPCCSIDGACTESSLRVQHHAEQPVQGHKAVWRPHGAPCINKAVLQVNRNANQIDQTHPSHCPRSCPGKRRWRPASSSESQLQSPSTAASVASASSSGSGSPAEYELSRGPRTHQDSCNLAGGTPIRSPTWGSQTLSGVEVTLDSSWPTPAHRRHLTSRHRASAPEARPPPKPGAAAAVPPRRP